MSALMLAVEALVAPGDRVVVVTPLWPNLVEIPKILSAHVECVPLACDAGGWTLDVDRLLAALTPGTRARDDQLAEQSDRLDAHARRAAGDPRRTAAATASGSSPTTCTSGSTIATTRAPRRRSSTSPTRTSASISTNSFSKSWLMTGWRLGWIVAPDGAHARPRQAHRVQHVVFAGVRPARGRGRRHAGRADDRAHARALPARARLPGGRAARDCRAWRSRRRRARCTRSSASRA